MYYQRYPLTALSKILGFTGLIPFLLCPLFVFMGLPENAIVYHIFCLYSAVILSFLGGTVWGASLQRSRAPQALTIFSVIYPLLAWVCLLWNALQVTLSLFILAYVHLWILEKKAYDWEQLPYGYKAFRTTLTTIVVLAHCSLLLYLFL
jgi:hypothetical protein